jgi:purine-binding chemotaxis protein CheW
VIITEVTVDGDTTVLGCLADSVQEVLDLGPEQISAPPKIGTKLRTEFITGMGKRDDRFLIILDIDRVFSAEDLAQVQCMGPGGASLKGHAAPVLFCPDTA